MNISSSQRKEIRGRGIPVKGNDIDTDQIIPARFLKEITFDSLGNHAFSDLRYHADGSKKDHPFNEEKYKDASILVVNKNFGCGSSREHAPQSLLRHGIRAIIGESFAEIFEDNCTAIGIPAVTASKGDIENLMNVIKENPALEISIDIEKGEASYLDFSIAVSQKESARRVLTSGAWDSTSLLLKEKQSVGKVAQRLPYLNHFA
ncbi:MAG TPA: 3-isopropylmalate dehydratase small subunit [Candidatus Nanoarchaeia archaeon]|nr:3-isopropylmalate dehydratase small subunit [Candidatus Nanoarchaeia archaeon]